MIVGDTLVKGQRQRQAGYWLLAYFTWVGLFGAWEMGWIGGGAHTQGYMAGGLIASLVVLLILAIMRR